ncbi:hypothetical protein ACH5RR_034294 [Cinchona calisaya]|uniref:Neprosin PEP catalytic domain-containing protein n=1 Tax=Cinchona calisaya TaxID=153742 RepID=A0ABD2YFX9_9GENT
MEKHAIDYKLIVVLFYALIFKFIPDGVEANIVGKEERQKHPTFLTAKNNLGKNSVDLLTKGSFMHEDKDENFAGIKLRTDGKGYIGAKAYVAIHKPKVDSKSHQFSAASIIIERGDNQIEAGWIVHPDLYHDENPRFYTRWTKDNHRSTGCYNTNCPGFVIVSDEYPLGYAFPEISDPNKAVQHDVKISIEQIDLSGRWYVSLNDSLLGYWPQSLFTNFGIAEAIRWGGQVYSQPLSNQSPQMGSGQFYGDNPYRTAYMKNVQVIFSDDTHGPPPSDLIEEVNSHCYFAAWASYSSDPSMRYHFLYGGKGEKDHVTCF